MSHLIKYSVTVLTFLGLYQSSAQTKTTEITDFNALSELFLADIKAGKETKLYLDQLENTTLEALENALQSDTQKLAFWINIYNAYIQVHLSKDPDVYADRQAFFNDDSINIGGEKIAFSKIEHGIIRKSQWPLGLGKIRKWLPDKFERRLRVDRRDYRVHFALNCGAKDCPPVAIYKADELENQFKKATENYLKQTTTYDPTNHTVAISSLFSWFRGDFGSRKNIKKILEAHQLIPNTKDVDISYKNYDWTLLLDNWAEL